VKGTLVIVDSSALLTAREIGSLPVRVVEIGVSRVDASGAASAPTGAGDGSPPGAPTRTSAVTPGEYVETFTWAARDGYSSALVLTIAAALSGTHQSATVAEQAAAELPSRRELSSLEVRIVDSGTAVGGLALLALAAARGAGDGPDTVVRDLKPLIPRVVTFGMVADWDAIRRGGRIPVGAIWAARHVGIYPCFRLARGSIRAWRLPRSQEGGLRSMVGAVGRLRGTGPLHVAAFGDDPEALASFAARFESLAPIELLALRANDVVAAHTGRDVIGVSAYREP
jgi:DegV family protein with EDD domain